MLNKIDPGTDGQIGLFGKWRDLSEDELAYESRVRAIAGFVGTIFGILCVIYAVDYARGALNAKLGLGVSIPLGCVAINLIGFALFFNYAHYLRGTHITDIKSILKKRFVDLAESLIDSEGKRCNLENLRGQNDLNIRQVNLLRHLLEKYYVLAKERSELDTFLHAPNVQRMREINAEIAGLEKRWEEG